MKLLAELQMTGGASRGSVGSAVRRDERLSTVMREYRRRERRRSASCLGTADADQTSRWAAADRGRRFDDLFNLVHDPRTLHAAFARVASNTGANTAGVDGLTVARIEQAGVLVFLKDLREQLRLGTFRPQPVRERKIPKPGGSGKLQHTNSILEEVLWLGILTNAECNSALVSEHPALLGGRRSARYGDVWVSTGGSRVGVGPGNNDRVRVTMTVAGLQAGLAGLRREWRSQPIS
jgi:hypothetical protein